jgi:hypothetical protein
METEPPQEEIDFEDYTVEELIIILKAVIEALRQNVENN